MPVQEVLFAKLCAGRLEVAHAVGKPPSVVLHDRVLKRIAATRPASADDLLAIKGIGPKKLEQYGPTVLAIVADHNPPIATGEAP